MKHYFALLLTFLLYNFALGQSSGIFIQMTKKGEGDVTGDFIVKDDLGRRTGADPLTNAIFREIPSAHYGTDGLDDHESPGEGVSWNEFLMVPGVKSTYKIKAIGVNTDSFNLNIQMGRVGVKTAIFNFFSTTSPGSVTEYEIFYDPDSTVTLTARLLHPVRVFSVFATHSIWLKQNSQILSGNVGVNAAGSPPFLASNVELTVGQGASTPSGTQLKAHGIKVKQSGVVNSDVFYNQLTNNGTINGSLNTPLTLPLFTTLPPFKSAPAGTQDVTVVQNDSISLAPGDYGDIKVKKKGIILFTGGIYNTRSLDFGNDTKMVFSGPSEIRIEEKFEIGQKAYVGPQDTTAMSAKDVVFYVAGINGNNGNLGTTPKVAKLGLTSTVFANFYVPNGTLWLRQNSASEGAFIGKDVIVGIGAKVTLNSAF